MLFIKSHWDIVRSLWAEDSDAHTKQKLKFKKFAKHRFTRIVLFPLLLAVIYNLFFATDRYASEARIVVKQVSHARSPASLQLGFIGGMSGSYKDAMIVKEYIFSMRMFEALVNEAGLLEHYKTGAKLDPFVTYWPWFTKELGYQYYADFVKITFDHESEVLNIEVQAFSPEYAQKQLAFMMQKSEDFINEIGNGLAKNQLKFFQAELEREQEKMRDAKNEMLSFQEKHGLLSPDDQSKAAVAVVNELKAEQTRIQTELATLRGFMSADSPQVQKLENHLEAVQMRLKGEHEIYAKSGDSSLNSLTAKFRDYLLSYAFAEDSYKLALKNLEEARIESYQKKNFLVMVSEPFVPEIAKYPTKFRNLLTFAIVMLCVYGIFVISFEIIKENR